MAGASVAQITHYYNHFFGHIIPIYERYGNGIVDISSVFPVDRVIFLAKIISMTLQTYDPQKLDQLALRLLDLAAMTRQMANQSREYDIADLALHDRKAIEWCEKLEQWARKTQADLEIRILQDKAQRRERPVHY
jgi:hypothetical protein